MELFQLDQFKAIAECGTISKAADKLFLTQPTLSQNLKKLEAELGCKLFIRAHNRLSLSPCGEIVLQYASEVASLTEKMREELDEAIARETDTVHVGFFSYGASSLLMPCIAEHYPALRFDVVICNGNDLKDGLETGRFDFVIATDDMSAKHFNMIKIYDERAYISMPREDASSGKKELSGADLSGKKILLETNATGYSDWYPRILGCAQSKDCTIMRAEFKDYLKKKDSIDYWSFTSDFFSRFVKQSDMRVVLPIAEDYAKRSVYLVHAHGCRQVVASFIQEFIKDLNLLLSGGSFVSYYLFPDNVNNLTIRND